MKYAWIEEHRDQFRVTRMCRQLEVSRTGYCQWRTRAPSDRSMANAALDAQVAAIHAGSQAQLRSATHRARAARARRCRSATNGCATASSGRTCARCTSDPIA